MVPSDLLKNPKLRKFIREYSTSEFIFEEGFLGDSLYIIIEGMVGISKKTAGGRRLMFTACDGDVVGEKAIISEPGYKHVTSAQTKSTVVTIEADRRGFAVVQALVPDLFPRMLKAIEQRVDQASDLAQILLSTNEIDRISEFTIHYFKFNKKIGKGLLITVDEITSATNVDPITAQKALDEFCKKQILKSAGKGYALLDEVALAQYAPELRDRLAA
ncbi:MAG: Crp/Fnr family transcriptional regulator [Deltaproteobacteria bacterium]|nr:Crp/Fnr family transcriptional regulator [Deltaproteobacteria bacterium]